jgi:hypothetical protein
MKMFFFDIKIPVRVIVFTAFMLCFDSIATKVRMTGEVEMVSWSSFGLTEVQSEHVPR